MFLIFFFTSLPFLLFPLSPPSFPSPFPSPFLSLILLCLPPLLPSQLVYDFKDGGGSLGLISLHPDKLLDQDKMKFKKIGVKIPSME